MSSDVTSSPAAAVLANQGKTGLALVTGATGFLGKHVVRALLEQGVPVRALGRKLNVGLELASMGAEFLPVDLRDATGMVEACRGVSAVVHSGALSSAWGRYKDFFDINVQGTANVLLGCHTHRVGRLVHISSPSVMSQHEPQLGLNEARPLPERFVSMYSETKALGERRVAAAANDGLAAVVLRPKAIYGPGDQAIFPRIIESLGKGRLPIIGEGETITNITHVSDVVQAVLLALRSEAAVGNTYLVTGGEDVNLWEVIEVLATTMNYPVPTRKVPMSKAMRVAGILEAVWRILRLGGEPPLTRYKASILGYSQTYDITAARRDLGYEPKVRWQDGVADFLEDLKRVPAELAGVAPAAIMAQELPALSVSVVQAGRVPGPARILGLGKSWRKVEVPALMAVLKHPVHGPILFDTGYSTRFYRATRHLPYRFYRMLTAPRMTRADNAVEQLSALGVAPQEVRWVVISHFDPDHIGGMRDFPKARFVCSWRAWHSVAGKEGIAAMRARVLPDLLPDDLAARLVLLPDATGPALGPFEHTSDLFGDGLITLVELPGHAPGMVGAVVRSDTDGLMLLCADACWSTLTLTGGGKATGMHGLIAENRLQQRATYRKLEDAREAMLGLHIVPSHCPAAAKQFVDKAKNR